MHQPDRWRRLLGGVVALACIIVLLYPMTGLWVPVGPWQWHGLVPGSSLEAAQVSLVLTSLALVIVIVLGTPLAWYLARHRGFGRLVVEAAVLLSVLTPPLALGILLSLAFSPKTALGAWLLRLGIPTSNTPAAFVVTQVYAALGYYVLAARSAFEQVPRALESVAALLGMEPWRVFLRITFPLARLGLGVALSLAWVRAIGEFGAVVVTAYYPAGMPVQLWVNLQDAGLPAVMPLLVIFLLTALPLPWIIHLAWTREHHA